mgnify:CR=1 FL=1
MQARDVPVGRYSKPNVTMALPAAMLMRRLGRRNAFMFGALFGTVGALIAAFAMFVEEFWWFVCGTIFTGAFNSFAMHFRFAAAEAADVAWRSRAISFVVGVGIVDVNAENLAEVAEEVLSARSLFRVRNAYVQERVGAKP